MNDTNIHNNDNDNNTNNTNNANIQIIILPRQALSEAFQAAGEVLHVELDEERVGEA